MLLDESNKFGLSSTFNELSDEEEIQEIFDFSRAEC